MRKYRIGDFAKELGVTSGLLKYYEQFNLVKPQISESGYRYYEFSQASRVIDCIQFKNLGFSLKELEFFLNSATSENINEKLTIKKQEIIKQIEIYASLVNEIEKMEDFYESMSKGEEWFINNSEDCYFLPHSLEFDFISNERTNLLIKEWSEFIPMVYSAQKIGCEDYYNHLQNKSVLGKFWGLMIPVSLADKFSLDTNAPVEFISKHKCLEYRYSGNHHGTSKEIYDDYIDLILEKPLAIINKLDCHISGDIYRKIFFKSFDNGNLIDNYVLYIPIAENV